MKTTIFALALAGILAPGISEMAASHHDAIPAGTTIQQTVQTQHKVYKKRRRVKRHTLKAARAQKQLQQGQKHLAEEQKVEKAQQKLKKDTTKKRP